MLRVWPRCTLALKLRKLSRTCSMVSRPLSTSAFSLRSFRRSRLIFFLSILRTTLPVSVRMKRQ